MIFYIAGRQQCETLRFWIYLVGSVIEAKNYSYSLLIKNNAGDENYSHQGKVFTLDIGMLNLPLRAIFILCKDIEVGGWS